MGWDRFTLSLLLLPSHLLDSGFIAEGSPNHSGGTAPEFHRFPYYPAVGTFGINAV